MTVLLLHMGKYSFFPIKTSRKNQVSITFPWLHFDFKNASSMLPHIRRGSLKDSSGPAISQVSTQLLLPPLYPRSFPKSHHHQECQDARMPSENSQSTDTASKLMNISALLRKL